MHFAWGHVGAVDVDGALRQGVLGVTALDAFILHLGCRMALLSLIEGEDVRRGAVVYVHQTGGPAGLFKRLGDHHRDQLPGVVNRLVFERRPNLRRLQTFLHVFLAPVQSGNIAMMQHREHPGRALRGGGIERGD